MGGTLVALGNGYSRIEWAMYTLLVAVTDEVAVAEKDDFLGIFSHHRVNNPEADWWLRNWMVESNVKQNIENVPGYEEMLQKLDEKILARMPLEKRLAGLAPEERLAGLTPEERLTGLTPEEQVLALPVDILRGLSEDYLRSLPPAIEQTIRRRITRSGD